MNDDTKLRIIEIDVMFAKWRSENPDAPAYMFGLDMESVPCLLNPASSHIGTRGEVRCECLQVAARVV